MKNDKVNQTKVVPLVQKSSHKVWLDDKGQKIPYNRIKPEEKLRERNAGKLYKQAVKMHLTLSAFKREMRDLCYEVYADFMARNQCEETPKGNFTWYNFDRSIKIKVKIQERIEFDEIGVEASKLKLQEFIRNNVDTKDDFIESLVLDAFQTSKGSLDTSKVLQLLRYRSRITAPLFQEAMTLLEDAIRHPDSKQYFQIWAKGEDDEYQNIDLNFSKIKAREDKK